MALGERASRSDVMPWNKDSRSRKAFAGKQWQEGRWQARQTQDGHSRSVLPQAFLRTAVLADAFLPAGLLQETHPFPQAPRLAAVKSELVHSALLSTSSAHASRSGQLSRRGPRWLEREPSCGMARRRRSRGHRRARCEERPVVARHRAGSDIQRASHQANPRARSTARSCRCAYCATVRCSRSRPCRPAAIADADAVSLQTPCAVMCRARRVPLPCSLISRGLPTEKTARTCLPKAVAQAAAQFWRALPDAKSLTDPDMLATAIARSGAFLEAHLAHDAGAPEAPPRAISRRCCCRSASRCVRPARDPMRRAATP